MAAVEIVEVGPRDGFQSIKPFIPTAVKIDLIQKLAACGFARMEVGSFVSPAALPQMADARAVLEAAQQQSGLQAFMLIPNRRGAEIALESGAKHLVTVVSASESHNQSNIRRSVAASLAELAEILRMGPAGFTLRYNIATAFHCPFEGRIDAAKVLAIIDHALRARADVEIGLCDTIGKAMPHEVTQLVSVCAKEFPQARWALHAHDTYGFGIANVLAAYEAGVRVFDGAAGGLGGCPFAPGASGNVATEDVAYAFDRMEISTGVQLTRLLDIANQAANLPGAEAGGHIRTTLVDGDICIKERAPLVAATLAGDVR